MLVGDEALMNNALRIRKMLGGGMRQIGSLAAAASYALDHQFDRLKEDHQKAKEIAAVLQQLKAVLSVEPVETNIVIFKLNSNKLETSFLDNLKAHDVLVSDMGSGKLRMVTHLDYTDEMHAIF
jgi:threonine aldolase